MDGFSDAFNNVNNNENGDNGDADPAAEFLAREQDTLGELDDDFKPVSNGPSSSEAVNSSSPTPSQHIVREEPEKIKRWREEQAERLAKKDDEEEDKKQEMKEAAKKELEEWYKNHEEQVAKTRKTNRSAEKELVADTEPMEPGTEWERIAKLCDFNPKGSKHQKDISRMRSIILKVKQNQPQPNQFVSQHPPPNNHMNNGQ